MPTVFFSYSHADEELRNQLETQLAMLKRQGVIETWHDRRIGAGQNIGEAIDGHINSAEIVLLLVSPDFLASDYCYEREMTRALERHEAGKAVVIPVILRACDWHNAPFKDLLATPRDGKPITKWPDRDEAFLEVVKAIRKQAERFSGGTSASAPTNTVDAKLTKSPVSAPTPAPANTAGPRSSNLNIAKTFTQRDKDRFQLETFEFIRRFFENSLDELAVRNPGLEGTFRQIDANRFFATIYREGKDVARCTIYVGGSLWGQNGICYVDGQTTESNTMNESIRVEADDQSLYLTSMGMARMTGERDKKLTQEGAAELFWSILISPLQQRSSKLRLV